MQLRVRALETVITRHLLPERPVKPVQATLQLAGHHAHNTNGSSPASNHQQHPKANTSPFPGYLHLSTIVPGLPRKRLWREDFLYCYNPG